MKHDVGPLKPASVVPVEARVLQRGRRKNPVGVVAVVLAACGLAIGIYGSWYVLGETHRYGDSFQGWMHCMSVGVNAYIASAGVSFAGLALAYQGFIAVGRSRRTPTIAVVVCVLHLALGIVTWSVFGQLRQPELFGGQ